MLWFVLIFLIIVVLYRKWKYRYISKIPGPPARLFMGNTFQVIGSLEHTWKYIQDQNQRFYPIYKLSNGFMLSVHLIDPDDIEMILSSKDHLRKSIVYEFLQSWLGTGLLTSYGEKWQNRRKLLTPTFHFNIIQQFFDTFLEHSTQLVDQLEAECTKPFTSLTPLITQFTLYTICETAMGSKLNENKAKHSEYVKAVYRIGELIIQRLRRPWLFSNFIYQLSSLGREQKRLVNILHNFSTSVIEDKKKDFAESDLGVLQIKSCSESKKRVAMLDLLLSLKNNGAQIDDEGIREEVDTFMFEGHDTTSAAISFTLMLLANHPNVQKKVLEEISFVMNSSDRPFTFMDIQQLNYLQLVIKESLRMYPSVALIGRRLDSDITTKTGYKIPKNTLLSLQIYGLHHNPKFYPNPERFDPDRFRPENLKGRHPFSYIPFSAGSRNCIGQKFAMVEMKTVIASIVRNFELLPIDKPEDLTLISQLILKTKEDIRVKFRKR